MAESKRFPLATILATRDAALTKDGLLTNAYHEKGPSGDLVVKRPGYEVLLNLGVGCSQGAVTYNGSAVFIQADQAIYIRLVGDVWGASSAPPKPTGGTVHNPSGRSGYLASFIGSLISIGGKDNADTDFGVYGSVDRGFTWTTLIAPGSAPWSSTAALRDSAGCAVVFNGVLYIILEDTVTFKAEIWATVDAITWTQRTADVTAGNSLGDVMALFVHAGALYAVFGIIGFGVTLTRSVDLGASWVKVGPAGNLPWTADQGVAFWSLSGIIYAGGGGTSTTAEQRMAQSYNNGLTWIGLTDAPWTPRKLMAYWVEDNKLWLAGGTDAFYTTANSEVWSSTDGLDWAMATATPGWPARWAPSFTVHADTLWIGPGVNDAGNFISDLWYAAIATFTAITTTNCAPFTLTEIPANGANPSIIFMKTATAAWTFDGTTITPIVDPDYPANTVPGVVYLDGSIYVMDTMAVIHGSDLNDPTSWSALNFVTANAEADFAVALALQLNYVVAFKTYSTQFFYDAGNATGSPLSAVQNATLKIGCAAAGSLAFAENRIYFVSQAKQKGRAVTKMDGYTPSTISTPFIERLLNADGLTTVYSFVIKSNGHFFYVLTLADSQITLVFDEQTQEWHQWTTMVAVPAVNLASATLEDDGSVLLTFMLPHGLADGDPILVSGIDPPNDFLNAQQSVTIVDNLSVSFFPDQAITDPITGGIEVVTYFESFFPGTFYSTGRGKDLLIDRASGQVYSFDPVIYQDNAAPVDVKIRTQLLDFETNVSKRFEQAEIIGDNVSTNVLVQYSDDDYQSYSIYEQVGISSFDRALLTNQGSARRRAYRLRHTENTPLRLKALEFWVKLGAF